MTVWDRLEKEILNDPIVHAAWTMRQKGQVETDEDALVFAVIALSQSRLDWIEELTKMRLAE